MSRYISSREYFSNQIDSYRNDRKKKRKKIVISLFFNLYLSISIDLVA